jgi:hypothetical protein
VSKLFRLAVDSLLSTCGRGLRAMVTVAVYDTARSIAAALAVGGGASPLGRSHAQPVSAGADLAQYAIEEA